MPELDLDSERRQTHFLLDALLAEKVSAVRGLLEVMVEPLSNSLAKVPVEEELTAVLDRARGSLARGEGVSHEEVLREFGVCDEKSPQRISIVWSEEARAELRRIDRQIALDILRCTPLPRHAQRRREKAQASADRIPAPLRRLSVVL